MDEGSPQRLRAAFGLVKRELTIERVAFLAYIALTVAYMILKQGADRPWAIYVDGRQVAVAPNRPTAAALCAEARRQQARGLSQDVRFVQKLNLRYAGWWKKPDGLVDALSAIEGATTVQVRVPAIHVNGKPIVGAASDATANAALNAAKLFYAKDVKSLYEEPRFKENVKVAPAWVSPQRVARSAEEGAQALTARAGRPTTHEVRKGEIAILIARKHGITLSQLQELNPGRDLDHLQIGDRLRVGAGNAPVTVIVKEARGRPGGERRIITYENGVEVRR